MKIVSRSVFVPVWSVITSEFCNLSKTESYSDAQGPYLWKIQLKPVNVVCFSRKASMSNR